MLTGNAAVLHIFINELVGEIPSEIGLLSGLSEFYLVSIRRLELSGLTPHHLSYSLSLR